HHPRGVRRLLVLGTADARGAPPGHAEDQPGGPSRLRLSRRTSRASLTMPVWATAVMAVESQPAKPVPEPLAPPDQARGLAQRPPLDAGDGRGRVRVPNP